MESLTDVDGNKIFYQGAPLEAGPLPAFFYFSLSGEESLELPPYNTPAALLRESALRVFSLTIPGHGPGFNKFHAIRYWADQMAQGNFVLETFFTQVSRAIEWLIARSFIDPNRIAVGGLSRGALIAVHVAARDTRIKTILGFSPLTRLDEVKEFASVEQPAHAKMHAHTLNMEELVDNLTHLHTLRFYIGNRDERVSTDACYHFIRKLADKGHEIRARHLHAELRITTSIGQHGHGTAPQTFEEGTGWIKEQLLGMS